MVYTESAETAAVSRGTMQSCNKCPALYVDRLGGYSKRGIKSCSHLFRNTLQKRSESARERRIVLYKSDHHHFDLVYEYNYYYYLLFSCLLCHYYHFMVSIIFMIMITLLVLLSYKYYDCYGYYVYNTCYCGYDYLLGWLKH